MTLCDEHSRQLEINAHDYPATWLLAHVQVDALLQGLTLLLVKHKLHWPALRGFYTAIWEHNLFQLPQRLSHVDVGAQAIRERAHPAAPRLLLLSGAATMPLTTALEALLLSANGPASCDGVRAALADFFCAPRSDTAANPPPLIFVACAAACGDGHCRTGQVNLAANSDTSAERSATEECSADVRFYTHGSAPALGQDLKTRAYHHANAAQRHFAANMCMRPAPGARAPCRCRASLLHAVLRLAAHEAPPSTSKSRSRALPRPREGACTGATRRRPPRRSQHQHQHRGGRAITYIQLRRGEPQFPWSYSSHMYTADATCVSLPTKYMSHMPVMERTRCARARQSDSFCCSLSRHQVTWWHVQVHMAINVLEVVGDVHFDGSRVTMV